MEVGGKQAKLRISPAYRCDSVFRLSEVPTPHNATINSESVPEDNEDRQIRMKHLNISNLMCINTLFTVMRVEVSVVQARCDKVLFHAAGSGRPIDHQQRKTRNLVDDTTSIINACTDHMLFWRCVRLHKTQAGNPQAPMGTPLCRIRQRGTRGAGGALKPPFSEKLTLFLHSGRAKKSDRIAKQ